MIYQKRNLEFEVLEQRQQLMKIKSYTKKIVGDVPKEYPQQIFNQLLAFQGYGFNECLDIHSLVELKDGSKIELKDVKIGDEIKSANNKFRHKYKNKLEYCADLDNIIYVKVKNIYHNKKSLYQITTSGKKQIIASLNHKFKVCRLKDLTTYMMKPLCEILDVHSHNLNNIHVFKDYYYLVTEDGLEMIDYDYIKPCGELPTIDLEVDDENHQFFANGILVSNSHSVAYSLYSAVDLFFKAHYPKEFICCLLNQYSRTEQIQGISAIKYLLNYARKKGIKIFKPDINRSKDKWFIDNEFLIQGFRFPFRDMMLLNTLDINNIINNQPYNNFQDFYNKVGKKLNSKKLDYLICSQAFHKFGDVTAILTERNRLQNSNDNDGDLFADFDDMVSDVSVYTKQQQQKMQQEMLNYSFKPLIVDKYEKYIEEYNKKAKSNNFTRLKTLQQIQSSTVKFTLILAQVIKIAFFTPKNGGGQKAWVFLSDGIYNAKLMLSKQDVQNRYSNYFKQGNVLQIPVMVSEQDRMTFFFNKNSERAELKILH